MPLLLLCCYCYCCYCFAAVVIVVVVIVVVVVVAVVAVVVVVLVAVAVAIVAEVPPEEDSAVPKSVDESDSHSRLPVEEVYDSIPVHAVDGSSSSSSIAHLLDTEKSEEER